MSSTLVTAVIGKYWFCFVLKNVIFIIKILYVKMCAAIDCKSITFNGKRFECQVVLKFDHSWTEKSYLTKVKYHFNKTVEKQLRVCTSSSYKGALSLIWKRCLGSPDKSKSSVQSFLSPVFISNTWNEIRVPGGVEIWPLLNRKSYPTKV